MTISNRFLTAYAGLLSVVCAASLLSGFAAREPKKDFDEISVKRINIIEPDGTIRMVISNSARFPGIIIKGKEYSHSNNRKTGGILFFNEEGTENGGLIFDGDKGPDGKGTNMGHLSFDRYLGDQTIVLDADESEGQYRSGLTINEQPNDLLEYMKESQKWTGLPETERQARRNAFFAGKSRAQTRVHLGRERDNSAALRLMDPAGHDRIIIEVQPDGKPRLQFLDHKGSIVSQLP